VYVIILFFLYAKTHALFKKLKIGIELQNELAISQQYCDKYNLIVFYYIGKLLISKILKKLIEK
jgi:hypothetical protein